LEVAQGRLDLKNVKGFSITDSVERDAVRAVERQKDIVVGVDCEVEGVGDVVGGVHFGEVAKGEGEGLDEDAEQADPGLFILGGSDDLLEFGDIEGLLVVEVGNAIAVIHYPLQ
jgi:hypothetical protein